MKVCLAVALLNFFWVTTAAHTYAGPGTSSLFCDDQGYPNCNKPNCYPGEAFYNKNITCYCHCSSVDAAQRRSVVDNTLVESSSGGQFVAVGGSTGRQSDVLGSSGHRSEFVSGSNLPFVDAGHSVNRRVNAPGSSSQRAEVGGGSRFVAVGGSTGRQSDVLGSSGHRSEFVSGSNLPFVDAGHSVDRRLNVPGSSSQRVEVGGGSDSHRVVELADSFSSRFGSKDSIGGQVGSFESTGRRFEVDSGSRERHVPASAAGGRRLDVISSFGGPTDIGGSIGRRIEGGLQDRVGSSLGRNFGRNSAGKHFTFGTDVGALGRNILNQVFGVVQHGTVFGRANLWNDAGGSQVRSGGFGSHGGISADRGVEVVGSGFHQFESVTSSTHQDGGVNSERGQSRRNLFGTFSDVVPVPDDSVFDVGVRGGGVTGRVFDSSVNGGVERGTITSAAEGGFDARRRRPASGY